jgi:SAM-dependent methyltransferase
MYETSWEKPKKVLQEMMRVLKPGGALIIQESFSDGEQSDAQMTDVLVHHWGAKIDRLNGETHFDTYTRKQIRNLVSSNTFSRIEDFESSRYVKCIFCEDMDKCGDPLLKENVDFSLKEIDDNLADGEGLEIYDELCREAEQWRGRARRTGVASASVLFFIGVK